MPRSAPQLPSQVLRATRKLGIDLRMARLRRRLPTRIVAERARISLPTLVRVEKGDASVSLGIYATVLWVLGLLEPLGRLASLEHDPFGLALEEERLPRRVRAAKNKT